MQENKYNNFIWHNLVQIYKLLIFWEYFKMLVPKVQSSVLKLL